MQYLLSQGLVTNTSESTKQYEKISLLKTSELYKMSLPNFPTGQYYAELHNNTFMLGILLDSNQNLYWAANANTMDYKGYPSSRNNTWNIYIFQLKLVNFPTELFLQVAISQKDNVASSGSRLLSETNTNFTFAYYLGYTRDSWFTNAELEDIINDIMYILIERPANSDEYYYNGTDTIITTCKTNYKLIDGICVCQFTLYNGECYPNCPQGCKTCTEEVCVLSDGTIICRDGYYMDQTCIICQTGLIPLQDKCLTCEEYHKEYTLCVTFDDHCECIECIDGYKLNGQICISCPVNCTTCLFDNICQQCSEGYYLKDGKCVKCVNNCLKCDSENECTSCDLGYYLDTGLVYNCVRCDDNCKKCQKNENNEVECEECKDGFYQTPFIWGKCIECEVNNCKSCHIPHQCEACQGDLILKSQECKCPSVDQFWDQSKKKCISCAENCKECGNQGKCNRCEDGYYLDDTRKCIKCFKDCKTCTKAKTCSTCDGKILSWGKCICKQGCSQCKQETQWGTEEEGKKVEIKLQEICLQAEDGYYLAGQIPTQCKESCLTCKDQNYCYTCKNHYFKDEENKCLNCPENCEDCYDQSTCKSCDVGFYLKDKQCKKCENCEECELVKSAIKCTKCAKSQYLKDNTCIDSNCQNELKDGKCDKCLKGSYLKDGQCEQCPSFCIECGISDKYFFCKACQPDYQFNNGLCEKKSNILQLIIIPLVLAGLYSLYKYRENIKGCIFQKSKEKKYPGQIEEDVEMTSKPDTAGKTQIERRDESIQ